MPSKHFNDDELRCRCGCGAAKMAEPFIFKLDQLREMLKGPKPRIMVAYRCSKHPHEATPTPHQLGLAVKIGAHGIDAMRLQAFAYALGFTGIGVMQHGPIEKRFIHLDMASSERNAPRPDVWTYAQEK